MERIKPVTASAASPEAKNLFKKIQSKFGKLPNIMATLGHSPSALQAYLGLNETLSGGSFTPKVREQISLAVAETNECEYCLSAHSAIGKMVGLEDDEIVRSRQVTSDDAKVDAILKLATRIVKKRGFLTDEDIRDARNANISDEEITETLANVAYNIFSNYFSHIAKTQVDFPKVNQLEKIA